MPRAKRQSKPGASRPQKTKQTELIQNLDSHGLGYSTVYIARGWLLDWEDRILEDGSGQEVGVLLISLLPETSKHKNLEDISTVNMILYPDDPIRERFLAKLNSGIIKRGDYLVMQAELLAPQEVIESIQENAEEYQQAALNRNKSYLGYPIDYVATLYDRKSMLDIHHSETNLWISQWIKWATITTAVIAAANLVWLVLTNPL